jgi:hypothetical protein
MGKFFLACVAASMLAACGSSELQSIQNRPDGAYVVKYTYGKDARMESYNKNGKMYMLTCTHGEPIHAIEDGVPTYYGQTVYMGERLDKLLDRTGGSYKCPDTSAVLEELLKYKMDEK